MEDIAKMEYKDEQGKITTIAYSTQLQKEAILWRKIEIGILIVIAILFALILWTNFPSQFLHQLVC
jgi:hypothetical protein